MFGILLLFWALLQYGWIKICSWSQLIIENFDQHSQEIKLKDYLKQTRMNDSNWMCQYCQNYIIVIIYF